MKHTILIVDDVPANLSMLNSVLKDTYNTRISTDGQGALDLALSDTPPDLILLDIMMPEMDGYQVCEKLKADPRSADIPIMFLTAKLGVEDETKGLSLGAVDYITKPISPPILLERVKNHLLLKEARDVLKHQNHILEEKVRERTQKLDEFQNVILEALGSLAEYRDTETGNHIRRTQFYVKYLAEELSLHDKYSDQLTPEYVTLLYKAAPLHDIGKVGIPDAILLKPGKLTSDEFEIMKRHTEYGRNTLASAEKKLSEPNELLTISKEITYSHQEKWDGTGYPEGLSKQEIPLSARIMAVADVYDALISKRIYKPAFSHDEAIAIMKEGRGSHFDPDILDAFLKIADKCSHIAISYADATDHID